MAPGRSGDHATAKGIRALVDAIRTVDRLRREKTQMAVFLDNDASQIEIDAVEQSLSNAPGVVTVRFESKEEAYERFKEVFADQPTLIETYPPMPSRSRFEFNSPRRRLSTRQRPWQRRCRELRKPRWT